MPRPVGEIELTYPSLDLPAGKRARHDLSFYSAEPGSPHEANLRLLASWSAADPVAQAPAAGDSVLPAHDPGVDL